jgi:hypothetical protein
MFSPSDSAGTPGESSTTAAEPSGRTATSGAICGGREASGTIAGAVEATNASSRPACVLQSLLCKFLYNTLGQFVMPATYLTLKYQLPRKPAAQQQEARVTPKACTYCIQQLLRQMPNSKLCASRQNSMLTSHYQNQDAIILRQHNHGYLDLLSRPAWWTIVSSPDEGELSTLSSCSGRVTVSP